MNDATDNRQHMILERRDAVPPRPSYPIACYGWPDAALLRELDDAGLAVVPKALSREIGDKDRGNVA